MDYANIILAYTQISRGQLPTKEPSSEIETILQIAWGVIGALALLMITISGFRYITSAGDPQKAASAKNGIIYALIGLVIAIVAQAIIAFVVNSL